MHSLPAYTNMLSLALHSPAGQLGAQIGQCLLASMMAVVAQTLSLGCVFVALLF